MSLLTRVRNESRRQEAQQAAVLLTHDSNAAHIHLTPEEAKQLLEGMTHFTDALFYKMVTRFARKILRESNK